jgi:hypothetical protein
VRFSFTAPYVPGTNHNENERLYRDIISLKKEEEKEEEISYSSSHCCKFRRG